MCVSYSSILIAQMLAPSAELVIDMPSHPINIVSIEALHTYQLYPLVGQSGRNRANIFTHQQYAFA